MYQIQIKVRCGHCQGRAFIDPYEVTDETGETHIRYKACSFCQATGGQIRWVTLPTFMQIMRAEEALIQLEGANHE